MSEQIRPGTRCQTLTLVRAVKGDLPRGSQGVIIREIENLGRHLIFVHWDVGITVPMFPDEIMTLEEQTVRPS